MDASHLVVVAEILLQEGASATVVADHGTTALLIATCNGYPEVAKLFIRTGADIEAAEP